MGVPVSILCGISCRINFLQGWRVRNGPPSLCLRYNRTVNNVIGRYMPAPKDPEANALWRLRMAEARRKLWEDPDYREARSKERKNKPKSPAHRAAIAAAHIGIGHTPATRALLSEINTGKTLSEETRRKIGDAHRGRTRSVEHNELMRKAIQAYWDSLSIEERKARNFYASDLVKSKWNSYSEEEKLERIRILNEGNKKFWSSLTEEEKKAIYKANGIKNSVANKAHWDNMDPEEKQARIFNMLSKSGRHPNGAETRLMGKLEEWLPGCYQYVGDGSLMIGNCNPDFIYEDKIIELFGEYWHQEGDEEPRISYFQQYNYQTLVIWENELKDPDLMDRVIAFTSGILPTA